MEKLPFDRISAEAEFSQITGVFNKAQHSTNSAPNLSNRGIRDFTEKFITLPNQINGNSPEVFP